jgi:Ca2+-binding RTX toxin-like protein
VIDLASKNLQTVERTPTQTVFLNGSFVELPVLSFDPHVKIKLGEALFSSATTVEKVLGSSFADVIRGNDAANVLSGRGGNDVLEGRGGDDILSGGADNDTYIFRGTALGTDTVTELNVNGTDTLDFSAFNQAISLNLGLLNSNQTINAGNLVVRLAGQVAVENVKGTSFSDVITGNRRSNVLEGGAGNDILRGAAGSDTLRGGEGNDELYGESGLDQLFGDAGDDRVEGGFDGLLDRLTGGAGADSFVSYHRRRPIQINGIDAAILVLAEADQRADFNSAEDRVLRMIVE